MIIGEYLKENNLRMSDLGWECFSLAVEKILPLVKYISTDSKFDKIWAYDLDEKVWTEIFIEALRYAKLKAFL